MEAETDFDMDIGYEEIVENKVIKIKANKNNFKKQCNSRILRHLLSCLSENKHAHMLKHPSGKKNEFEITFTNKKSPRWEKKDISLFKEMDGLFPKVRKMASYDEDCKVRFKANIQKLCSSGFLQRKGDRKESTCVTIVTYKILKFPDDMPSKAKSNGNRKSQVNVEKAVRDMESRIAVSTETSLENGPNMAVPVHGLAGKHNTVPSIVLICGIDNITNIEANGNLGVTINGTYLQGQDGVVTTYNNIEANRDPGVTFNGTDYLQEEDGVITTYNNIEANRNSGVICNGFDNLQSEDVLDTTNDDWNQGIELPDDYEEKMISDENPVLSSAWKDNVDIMDNSEFLLSEADWKEVFMKLK